jgi:diaminobutyrate-2-oxoglutarate transaminase
LSIEAHQPHLHHTLKTSAAYLERQRDRESNARTYPRRLPLAIAKAKGIHITDVDGDVYIDCLTSAGVLVLGHNHPVVVEAIVSHLEAELPLQTLDLTSPLKDAYTTAILESLPSEFANKAKIQFCGPSGSDGIEAAMKLVKTATGRSGMIAFRGGYHGHTNGALSLMGAKGAKNPARNLMSEVHFMPYPHGYRCPMNDKVNGDIACAAYLEEALTDPEGGISKPAGLVAEIIQGEAGSNPAPDRWVREIRRITHEQDIPFIVDEVQSCWGRTGKLYAIEHSGISPDVMVLSKAIGGGLPMTVMVYREELDVWKPGAHAGTFRGNMLAMSTGLATLRYIRENKLADHAERMGARLRSHLEEIAQKHAFIGHVRGLGLMLGMKIVAPEVVDAKGLASPDHDRAARIQQEAFKRKLIIELGGRNGSVLRFIPPIIVTEAQVDQIAEIIDQSCAAVADETL